MAPNPTAVLHLTITSCSEPIVPDGQFYDDCQRHPDHYHPEVERVSPKHPPWTDFQGVSWTKPILDYTGRDTARQIESWLRECVDEHSKCGTALCGEIIEKDPETSSLDRSALPLRVLDVGSVDSPLVKLIVTAPTTPAAPYVALSHCWGPPDKQPLRTTWDTFMEHTRSGIPMVRLPRTFVDAVCITRGLGIRYLWIDSLCIVQDSRSDWEAESQKMGSIYEGATLTLGAAHALDSSEGLFKGLRRLDPNTVVKVYTPMPGSSTMAPFATYFIFDPAQLIPEGLPEALKIGAWYDSPLAKRAWVMQEWMLSRRFVWAESISLYWKCREEEKVEPRTVSIPRHLPSFYDLTSNWSRLVQDYTRMQLTYERDRLPALHGIVTLLKAYPMTTNDEYHFGIWFKQNDTPSQLLWEKTNLHTNYPLERCHWRIPSWSWASVPDPKIFPAAGRRPKNHYDSKLGINANIGGTELHLHAPVGVVELCLEENYDELCREQSASRYRRMSIYLKPEQTSSAWSVNSAILSSNKIHNPSTSKGTTKTGVALGCLTLDDTIDIVGCPTPSGITQHVIPLISLMSFDGCTDYMLVVEPVSKPDGSKAYRRVGMGFVQQNETKGVDWRRWKKILHKMKMEDIVLV